MASITFTNGGGQQQFTLPMTDWWSATALDGDQIAATCTYINTWTGQMQNKVVNVYYFAVTINPPTGDTIQSVMLPATVSVGQMHIFAIGTK
jgi:hypothetical protein